MLVVDKVPLLFQKLAVKTNVGNVEWFRNVETALKHSKTVRSEQLYNNLFKSVGGGIDGPTCIDVLELDGPKDARGTTLSVLVGEIHGNNGGCPQHVVNIFKLVTNTMLSSSNVFLILEAFFHMLVFTVEDVDALSRDLESSSKGNVHSLWNACACIGNGTTPCKVGNVKVGYLILFRAFTFIIQATVVYLKSEGITTSVFHDLSSRIFHMDLREDLGLVPYEWLKGKNEESEVVRMLTQAKPMISRFLPIVESPDLRKLYKKHVFDSLMDDINKCIEKPTKALYTQIFVTIPELVTLAVHFRIMEKYKHLNPQILVVVGDSHRENTNYLLSKSLSERVNTKARFTANNSAKSCTRV